jgi:DNA-binding LytR/AlgR family response regulator
MEQKLAALIVDDEEDARKLLFKLLEETQYFNKIRTSKSVNSANSELIHFDPDLVFLDIKMPDKDGFSLIQELEQKKKKPGIVFVTAFEQFAIQAIKNQAFDYLLKPVNRKELKKCVQKFMEKRGDGQMTDRKVKSIDPLEKLSRIRVNTRTGTAFINPASILYCKADGNYTSIFTGDKQHLCSMNLGKVEEHLNMDGFIRVGRSYIINFEYITLLDRKGSQITLTKDGESVTIKIPRQHLKDLDLL